MLSEKEKLTLEKELLEAVIAGLEQDKIEVHELRHMADEILGRIDEVQTHEEFVHLIAALAGRWPFFEHFLKTVRHGHQN